MIRQNSGPAERGLRGADFKPIARNGFGDQQNAYSHCMAYFNGDLYVGATRNSMALLKLFPPIDPPALSPWPVDVPPRVQDLDMRGQIWRWSSKTEEWELVFRSPLIIGKNDEEVPRDLGYRGMAVFQGRSDPVSALYVATMSTVLRGTAAHILRSYDGTEFVPVSEPGLGDPRISTFRSLTAFDGHLYAPPAGEGVNFNSNRRSTVMRSPDPEIGRWEPACETGFGDPTNNGIFQMAEFNDHLYAGTFNHYHGYQIWKTPANGGGPCRWTRILKRGAYRGPLSQVAMSLCPFNGALYVGSAIQNGGYDRYNLVGPASGEVIRIYPDDSWELLVGTPRETPHGTKYPLSGLGPGFDNIFAGYIWRMVVHDGWLYVTTFDWSIFLLYATRASPTARRLVDEFGTEHLIENAGGFEMRRTKDGINWFTVTQNGFGNPYNYGGRSLVSTPEGLFVGTANPFGPKVAAKLGLISTYVPNPQGGTEVWLGRDWEGEPNPERSGIESAPVGAPTIVTGSRADTQEVLVTGATGFIGSRFMQRLLKAGKRVRVLVLPGTAQDLPTSDGLDVVEGGLDDPAALTRAVKGASIVCHLAARLGGSCPKAELYKVNVDGTHALLRACADVDGLKRFVFASSVAVYQGQYQPEQWPLTESSALRTDGGQDLTDYGMSKIAGENLAQWFARECGFEYTILRVSFCYGVGSADMDLLVQQAAENPAFGQGPTGNLPRQYVHVDDVAEVLMQATFREAAANEVLNVAGTDTTTHLDIAKFVRAYRGTTTLADLVPDRTRVRRRYVMPYKIGKMRRLLGFAPSITMQDGLVEILETKDWGPLQHEPRERASAGLR
jgi:nucleoside-diphosphate-sugar epimerase